MKTCPRTFASVLCLALSLHTNLRAQNTATTSEPDAAAAKPSLVASETVASPEHLQRADKIVATLGLAEPEQVVRIRNLVAMQYTNLSLVHGARDDAIKAAETADSGPEAVQAARDKAASQQADLHYAFLARLHAELTAAQVEQIKDGLTYGVVPNTFKVYQEMLPDITPEQRTQILTWLLEAREHAMDAGSSKEKHAWFGKYKGRINNYLSKAGYDMKQAERDMFARKKQVEQRTE